jgi:hypothetical protein
MTDIVLEFILTRGTKRELIGESLFMDATTETPIHDCAQWIAHAIDDPKQQSHYQTICLLLGDFGAHRFRFLRDRWVGLLAKTETTRTVGDLLCYDQPITVTYETQEASEHYEIFVKLLTGKMLDFLVNGTKDTIGDLKVMINKAEGIPTSEIHPVLNGRSLKDYSDQTMLADCSVQPGSVIHLVLRLGGGSFVDVTRDDAIRKKPWNESAPLWRLAAPGLCLEGYCRNQNCQADGEMVIVNKGFQNFNLFGNEECLCPMCRHAVKPLVPGFNNCLWKISAIKKESPEAIFHHPWSKAENEYTTYDESTAGMTEFSRLHIFVHRLQRDTEWAASGQEFCPICIVRLERDKVRQFDNGDCGHYYHVKCLDQWKDALSERGLEVFCVMCRRSSELLLG